MTKDTIKPVTKYIQKAIDSLNQGSIEDSLLQSCIAIDISSKRRYKGKKPGDRIKKFVDDGFIVLMKAYTGIVWIREPGSDVVFPWKDGGKIDVKSLVYEVIRCGLVHDGELDSAVQVENTSRAGFDKNSRRIIISNSFAWGLILMVVTADVNHNEGPLVRDRVVVKGKNASLNFKVGSYWGESEKLLKELDQVPPLYE